MPKPTCQLNLTLDVPTAEKVEDIAYKANLRPSGAGRVLLLQRLKLEEAGWKLGDEELFELLESIALAGDKGKESIKEKLRSLLSE